MKLLVFIVIVLFVILLGTLVYFIVTKNPSCEKCKECPECEKCEKCKECPKIQKYNIVNGKCVKNDIGIYTAEDCIEKCTIKSIPEGYTHALYKNWLGKDLKPSNSNTEWTYFTSTDPTHGLVNYGAHNDLISNDNDSIIIKVGKEIVEGKRNSIRLQTTELFTHGVFVLSVDHIPEGLAIWPAFWLLGIGSTWPCFGEIDIIEGVNSVKENEQSNYNQSTLHTDNSCDQSDVPGILSNNCNAAASDKTKWTTCGCSGTKVCATLGCGKIWGKDTFGYGFNATGKGGVFACQVTKEGQVTMWFFEKDKLPFSLTDDKIDISKWTNPVVKYNVCKDAFKNLQLIINTTLCGDWAGTKYDDGKGNTGESSCAGEVYDPNYTMENAFWKINWLKIFKEPE